MLPLTIGFLIAGPASGAISDRFGARAFATGGLLLTAATFLGLIFLPANFNYVQFAALLALNGIGMGLMAAPNSAAIMNAVPARSRGAASGIRATGMNAGMVLSMGGFFTLMAVGLASRLPNALSSGLTGAGVSSAQATAASHVSPVGSLFAAFLGDNPIRDLVPDAHGAVANRIYDGHFFPNLISDPFRHGLLIAFSASIVMLLIAAGASLMRGERFVHDDADTAADRPAAAPSLTKVLAPVGGPADGEDHKVLEAIAREGDALASPAVPTEDVAFDDAVAGRDVTLADLRD
jgi:MFS family permease